MSEVIDLLKKLVSIDSVNPGLIEGAVGEGPISEFVEEWFKSRGFEIQRFEDTPGRPSLVATARGTGGGRALMFNGHLDTVGVTDYNGEPHNPKIVDGKLYGRGSSDMKGGLAALMIAAARAARAELAGDIVVACVADEEHTSIGTAELVRHGVKADAAIVAEPVGYEIVTAHKGFMWFEIVVQGRSAHGSRPDLGIDAIAKAGKFLVALEEYGDNLAERTPHPLTGVPSVHASLIRGGQEVTSYPAECTISIERRTVPGETVESVEAELQTILNGIAAADPKFSARLVRGRYGSPFEVDRNDPLVSNLQRIAEEVVGHPPPLGSMNGWTDCALLSDVGIPSVVFGPIGRGGHSATEYVEVESVETLVEILTAAALEFCARPVSDQSGG